MALLAPRRRGERPDRRPAGAAADQDQRPVSLAQERAAERPAHLHAMAGADRRADLGRHQPAGIAPDMEDELARSAGAVETHRRAEVARREAGELDAEILPRPHLDRACERDDDLDDVRGERRDAGDGAGALGNLRHMIERDLGIADDFRLAGEHGAFFGGAAIVDPAAHHGDAAGLALARVAIVRDRDPARQARVHQRLAAIGFDGLAVDDEIETHATLLTRERRRLFLRHDAHRARVTACGGSARGRTPRPTCRGLCRARNPCRTCCRSSARARSRASSSRRASASRRTRSPRSPS